MVDLGIGKSIIAAEIFVRMKMLKYKVELCTEYAKDLVYECRNQTIKDQIYIFGKMQHKLNILSKTVDYAIVDSPLILSVVYKQRISELDNISNETFKSLVLQVRQLYKNIDICLIREKNCEYFEQYGRIQNLNESINIDKQIENCLSNSGINDYYSVINRNNQFNETVDTIMNDIILKNINDKKKENNYVI